MNKNINFIITGLLLTLCYQLNAQEILTIEKAVEIALDNNYEIKISRNDLKIDERNVHPGNAGMLPSLDAAVNNNNTRQNITQTQQDGTERSLNEARNFNLNYGLAFNWTIFDGFKMFARYSQLKELEKLGENELKLTILSKLGEVMSTYYELVQLQQQLSALDSTIVISKQRLNIAGNRYTIGKASKLEVLNAEVDLNTDITTSLKQEVLYKNGRIRLNELLARDPETIFSVMEEIDINKDLLLAELVKQAEAQNPQLQSQLISKRIQELELKQVKAERYPVLRVNSGYNFIRSESPLGFITESNIKGFNYGFAATLPIFNGFAQNRNEKIALIELENASTALEQQSLLMHSQLSQAYQAYQTNLKLIELEAQNTEIAKQNLEITLDKFNIGTIPAIEFRTAQVNYVNAKVRYNNAQYLAKLSEIALMELTGNLLLKI